MNLKGIIFNDVEELSKVWDNLSNNTQTLIAKAFSGYEGMNLFFGLMEGYVNMTKNIEESVEIIKNHDNDCVDLKKVTDKEIDSYMIHKKYDPILNSEQIKFFDTVGKSCDDMIKFLKEAEKNHEDGTEE